MADDKVGAFADDLNVVFKQQLHVKCNSEIFERTLQRNLAAEKGDSGETFYLRPNKEDHRAFIKVDLHSHSLRNVGADWKAA